MNIKNERLEIRLSKDEKVVISELAKKYNMRMSELILSLVNYLKNIEDSNIPLGLTLDIILRTNEYRNRI